MSRAIRLNNVRTAKRAARVRRRIKADNSGRIRLSVHRTETHISVQLIDDTKGITLAAASTMEKDLRKSNKGNIAAATAVGELIAKRAKEKGVTEVVFDKGAFKFHGRVKALAEAARAGGVKF
ncbi:MAG TPA: 50S ribosomal protein L18 [Alphaproteobacteria bacterium]|nr:50S ribosomal protein L18 [Rhodospirillaceae bacterium]HRJ11821.1 50S ribosomal protein L18 [Alphaproteobacteria bacterium]